MNFRLVPFDQLSADELADWQALRGATWDSPYFDPLYIAAVHAHRPVQVVLAPGFILPLHISGSIATPAGSPGADFQGPILAPGVRFAPKALLQAAGVKMFKFDHLLDGCADLDPWVEERQSSPYIDMTGGLEGYLGRASKTGKDNITKARRLSAKAGRELGPITFVAASAESSDLDRVIEIKREQYQSTGVHDYFADPTRRDLLHRLHRDGMGVLSTVRAGPHLIAAHFGIQSGRVLHWWFPVYDKNAAHLSPGWILLRELAQAAPAMGVTRMDLGRGEGEFKRRAMTGSSTVCIGAVTSGAFRTAARKAIKTAIKAAKSSPLAPQLRALAKKLR